VPYHSPESNPQSIISLRDADTLDTQIRAFWFSKSSELEK